MFSDAAVKRPRVVAAKIRFEVVPGVSSVVAAPNYGRVPLTHANIV